MLRMNLLKAFVLASLLPTGLLFVGSRAEAATLVAFTCNIAQVDIDVANQHSNRLMAKCDAPGNGVGGASIFYFAVDMVANPERAKMVLSTLTAAKVAGHSVNIFYFSDDTSTTGWGMSCNPADCRPIQRIVLN